MSISTEIQQAMIFGQNFIYLDCQVFDVIAWLREELGRDVEEDVEEDVDYFIGFDIDVHGNKICVISFADDTKIDLQITVKED